MYVGRFVVVGPDVAAYRVSSRSFPNREVRERESALTVGPAAEAEPMDNPYVEYNCVRTTEGGAQAVLDEQPIVTDITMVKAGITGRGHDCPAPAVDPAGSAAARGARTGPLSGDTFRRHATVTLSSGPPLGDFSLDFSVAAG